jgi:hypothetical protein
MGRVVAAAAVVLLARHRLDQGAAQEVALLRLLLSAEPMLIRLAQGELVAQMAGTLLAETVAKGLSQLKNGELKGKS